MLAQCVCVFSLDLSELNFSGQKCKAKELKITLTRRCFTNRTTHNWRNDRCLKKKKNYIGVSYVFSFPSKAQGAEALTV